VNDVEQERDELHDSLTLEIEKGYLFSHSFNIPVAFEFLTYILHLSDGTRASHDTHARGSL